MAHKAIDLKQAMARSARTEHKLPAAPPPEAPAQTWSPTENPHYRPSRVNKSNLTGYFPQAVKQQLKILAAEQNSTIQRLMAEALNDVFAKYGKPEIAPLD